MSMLEDRSSYINGSESAQDTDVGEVNPSHAYYNGSRLSKVIEDPSWSTSIKTGSHKCHLQHKLVFSEWIEVHDLARKIKLKDTPQLLSNLSQKFTWIRNTTQKLNIPPPPELLKVDLFAEKKKELTQGEKKNKDLV
ncbi:hypothetical protein Tco_0418501 [Tanacetum coccineum]